MFLIPQKELAASTAPYADLFSRVLGGGYGAVIAAFVIISALGVLNGWTLLAGEVVQSMGRHGGLPPGPQPRELARRPGARAAAHRRSHQHRAAVQCHRLGRQDLHAPHRDRHRGDAAAVFRQHSGARALQAPRVSCRRGRPRAPGARLRRARRGDLLRLGFARHRRRAAAVAAGTGRCGRVAVPVVAAHPAPARRARSAAPSRSGPSDSGSDRAARPATNPLAPQPAGIAAAAGAAPRRRPGSRRRSARSRRPGACPRG